MSSRNTFHDMPLLKKLYLSVFTAYCAYFSINPCTAFTIGVKVICKMYVNT